MGFIEFKHAFQQHVAMLLEQPHLFVTGVDKDLLWETYLDSFPPGTNEIYRERRDHDCSCCRHFIRAYGGVVAIADNELVTLWDFQADDSAYQPVVNALDRLVRSYSVQDVFVTKHAKLGTDKNYEQFESGDVHTWEHFYLELPSHLVSNSRKSEAELKGEFRDSKNVFQRSLEELLPDAVETVLDLIAEKSLYKGDEWRGALTKFSELQAGYRGLPEDKRDNYCWITSTQLGGSISRIRNHSIGVLLQDISAGVDVIDAVKRYESIVAPQNYKRPKAIFTKRMVEQAQETVEELGLLDSLGRRFATLGDVSVNNVLFADRDAKTHMDGVGGVFEALKQEAAVNPRKFDDVPGIVVEQFLSELPNTTTIEALLENRHQANLVSLIAPQVSNSPTLFKWDNGFSWAYNGNVTDSMKQRVKAAGGNVEGVLRFSLQWNENGDNQNDFDCHCLEPNGNRIYFRNMGPHPTTGVLDVDIIHPNRDQVAVENITWSNLSRMREGTYHLYVHNYTHRGGRSGFRAEIEYDGQIWEYDYSKDFAQNENITVAKLYFTRRDGIKFLESLPSSTSTREIWGLKTNQFHPVSLVAFSPNYWDDQHGIGHKHYLFMLARCVNDDQPNGFFNEYLRESLMEHKRVFAALGSKMRVAQTDDQLSGLGFSSTKRDSLVCKVDDRVVKIIF